VVRFSNRPAGPVILLGDFSASNTANQSIRTQWSYDGDNTIQVKSIGGSIRSKLQPANWWRIHVGGTIGRHRDHRDLGRAFAPGCAGGPGGGSAGAMRE
jgi:hypothetical protein